MKYFLLYLLIINACAFSLMLEDKKRARQKQFRIPEATLLAAAVLGGSVGAFLGMYLSHHKTRHAKFTLGIPAIFAMQATAVFLYFEFR